MHATVVVRYPYRKFNVVRSDGILASPWAVPLAESITHLNPATMMQMLAPVAALLVCPLLWPSPPCARRWSAAAPPPIEEHRELADLPPDEQCDQISRDRAACHGAAQQRRLRHHRAPGRIYHIMMHEGGGNWSHMVADDLVPYSGTWICEMLHMPYLNINHSEKKNHT